MIQLTGPTSHQINEIKGEKMPLIIAKKPLKCFDKERRRKNFIYRIDRGIATVNIDKIVGSVGRCLDFDAKFSLQANHSLGRLESVKRALEDFKPLPLIELYKMDDEYYVVDGHHRIAAAKQLGQKFIDAHIIEYFPPANNRENLLRRKRIEFEYETGLGGILFSRRSSYNKSLQQIKEHQMYLKEKEGINVSVKEAAKDWFQKMYYPITRKIREEHLSGYLKDATTPGDVYIYLCDQLQLHNRKNDRYVSFDEAMKEVILFTKATQVIFSGESLKDKLLKILLPCYYLKRCPYNI